MFFGKINFFYFAFQNRTKKLKRKIYYCSYVFFSFETSKKSSYLVTKNAYENALKEKYFTSDKFGLITFYSSQLFPIFPQQPTKGKINPTMPTNLVFHSKASYSVL